MPTSKLELQMRHDVRDAMKGIWELSYHEDGRVNPGIPDFSYVMLGGNFETGWLELKYEPFVFGKNKVKFKLRAEQINWIRAHRRYGIPTHVLCRWGDRDWLINPANILVLQESVTEVDLNRASQANWASEEIRIWLPEILRKASFRGRNV